MFCPMCNSSNVYVKDTMTGTDGSVYRRRRCANCNSNFRTVETVMDDTTESRKNYLDAVVNKSPLFKAVADEKRKRKEGNR